MRKILFKAKSIRTGEWVEGYLYIRKDGVAEISCYDEDLEIERYTHEVDSDTICQYTGLTDKNGKKVFIGDIVKCSRGCPHEVIWLEEYGGTYVGGMPAIYLSGLLNGYAWTDLEEVIGNVFDNAELVKGCSDVR